MRVEAITDTADPAPEGLQQVTLNPLASGKAQRHNSSKSIAVESNKEFAQLRRSKGNVKLEKLIKENPWKIYGSQNEDGDSTLHTAITLNRKGIVLYLISKAPHPSTLDSRNSRGQSPLFVAVARRQAIIARRLILAGADPTLANSEGNTPLHAACLNGDAACVAALINPPDRSEEMFITPGIFVQRQNLEQRNFTSGQSCLHIAALQGHAEIVALLLKRGADPEAREHLEGRTPLHLAIRRGCRSVIAALLKGGNRALDTPTYAGVTAYQLALRMGDESLASYLVQRGAKPEPIQDSDSDSEVIDRN